MKNGKTVFYKGSNVKISVDEDKFEEETVKSKQSEYYRIWFRY